MMAKAKKVHRVFIWRFTDAKDAKAFEEFQLKAIIEGDGVSDALLMFIKIYNEDRKLKFTPVTETEMVSILRKKKFKTVRHWLKDLRDTGQLVDGDGFDLWYTDGRNIVYNKEGVLEFVKNRLNKGGK